MLLDAIAIRRADSRAPPPVTISATIDCGGDARPGSRWRSRHVTVMFCDLVDSTGIAASSNVRPVAFPWCRVKLNFDVGVGLSFAA
jgi:class 3 adenylate cyclase